MIVPPALQDVPETIALESSISSSVDGDSDNHCSSTSRDLSTEGTPSDMRDVEGRALSPPTTNMEADMVVFEEWENKLRLSPLATKMEANVVVIKEWENKVISGRLDNLRKAPKTLPTGFRFKAALHHEVADGSTTVKRYKKLEEMLIFVHDTRTERMNNELAARLSEWRTPNIGRLILMSVHLRHLATHPKESEAQAQCPDPKPSREFKLNLQILKGSCCTSETDGSTLEYSLSASKGRVGKTASSTRAANNWPLRNIQAAKEEASRAEDWAKRAKSDRDKVLSELNSLKDKVVEANQNVVRAEASLEQAKKHHQHTICFARAQGAKWLVGANMFQDAMGEEMDEQGKSLAPPTDATVRLRWELNKERMLAEPSSTPLSSQPAIAPTFPSPAWSTQGRSSLARPTIAPTDASIPIDLTDD
ncbi:hypothetical protein SLEP1_g24331 [Rubroshorea leprosula]|uniref:Uncharacterized protein n=1 Tax=Rubroshorea leprosula TaxID=152421 RepID=A0AAV5JID5_9ROSI|nr:hypothetical protein SLEP1_g24331 [Rubroshorea leprosula]